MSSWPPATAISRASRTPRAQCPPASCTCLSRNTGAPTSCLPEASSSSVRGQAASRSLASSAGRAGTWCSPSGVTPGPRGATGIETSGTGSRTWSGRCRWTTCRTPGVARRAPSIPLTGACGGADIDLGLLSEEGVTVTGRLLGFDERRAHFADDLERNLRDSDSLLSLLLAGIDAHIDQHGLDKLPRTTVDPIVLPAAPERIYLGSRTIGTVIWATGYRRHYPWLRVRGACGQDGEIVQRHGITPVPGLYTIGIRFQSRRTSHFIGGAGQDAAELAEVIAGATHRRAEIRRRLSPKALPATG